MSDYKSAPELCERASKSLAMTIMKFPKHGTVWVETESKYLRLNF